MAEGGVSSTGDEHLSDFQEPDLKNSAILYIHVENDEGNTLVDLTGSSSHEIHSISLSQYMHIPSSDPNTIILKKFHVPVSNENFAMEQNASNEARALVLQHEVPITTIVLPQFLPTASNGAILLQNVSNPSNTILLQNVIQVQADGSNKTGINISMGSQILILPEQFCGSQEVVIIDQTEPEIMYDEFKEMPTDLKLRPHCFILIQVIDSEPKLKYFVLKEPYRDMLGQQLANPKITSSERETSEDSYKEKMSEFLIFTRRKKRTKRRICKRRNSSTDTSSSENEQIWIPLGKRKQSDRLQNKRWKRRSLRQRDDNF